MLPEEPSKRLGNTAVYIRKALKFYDMKNERITPLIFIIILLAGFSGAFLPETAGFFDSTNIIYNIVSTAVILVASSIYLKAYIKELKGESCTLGECASGVFKKLPRLIAAFFIFNALTVIGIVALVIPGLIINTMFLFYTCFILDKDSGAIKSLSQSKAVTAGKKMEIFVVLLLFGLLLYLPILIIIMIAVSSEKILVLSFVTTFLFSLTNLMQQRLLALMYRDIVYGKNYKGIIEDKKDEES